MTGKEQASEAFWHLVAWMFENPWEVLFSVLLVYMLWRAIQ